MKMVIYFNENTAISTVYITHLYTYVDCHNSCFSRLRTCRCQRLILIHGGMIRGPSVCVSLI